MWTWLITTKLGRSVGGIVGALLLCGVIYTAWTIWLARHDAALLKGYVLEERAVTAEAKLAEVERQAKVNAILADAYQTQYKNLLAQQAQSDEKAEADRTAYVGQKPTDHQASDDLDDHDINFLLRNKRQGTVKGPR